MAVTQVAHKQNYSWSLNPIFIWMRLIGVELNCSRSPSGRILLTVLGCVSLLFSVASFVYGFIFLYHNRRHISIETQSTNTFLLGLFISFTNFALRAISIQSPFIRISSCAAGAIGQTFSPSSNRWSYVSRQTPNFTPESACGPFCPFATLCYR